MFDSMNIEVDQISKEARCASSLASVLILAYT